MAPNVAPSFYIGGKEPHLFEEEVLNCLLIPKGATFIVQKEPHFPFKVGKLSKNFQ
mgnify:CR=1 FL=1